MLLSRLVSVCQSVCLSVNSFAFSSVLSGEGPNTDTGKVQGYIFVVGLNHIVLTLFSDGECRRKEPREESSREGIEHPGNGVKTASRQPIRRRRGLQS